MRNLVCYIHQDIAVLLPNKVLLFLLRWWYPLTRGLS